MAHSAFAWSSAPPGNLEEPVSNPVAECGSSRSPICDRASTAPLTLTKVRISTLAPNTAQPPCRRYLTSTSSRGLPLVIDKRKHLYNYDAPLPGAREAAYPRGLGIERFTTSEGHRYDGSTVQLIISGLGTNMAGTTQKNPLVVCVVAENCLVTAYLQSLLQQDSSIQTVSLEHVLRHRSQWGAKPTFIVDARGLSAPLGECLRRLSMAFAESRFLILDEERSTEEAAGLLLLGAHGFLAHMHVSTMLKRAVRFVAEGHFWVAPGVLEAYLLKASVNLRSGHRARDQVTPRENEILDLVRKRLSNKEIAELLHIRESTVKFHVTHILSKFQVSCREDLFPALLRSVWDKLPS